MDGSKTKLQARSATAQYGISFEWALARLPLSRVPDSMMLSTQQERGLAALATALALIFTTVFTSRVTNDMSDIRRHRSAAEIPESSIKGSPGISCAVGVREGVKGIRTHL